MHMLLIARAPASRHNTPANFLLLRVLLLRVERSAPVYRAKPSARQKRARRPPQQPGAPRASGPAQAGGDAGGDADGDAGGDAGAGEAAGVTARPADEEVLASIDIPLRVSGKVASAASTHCRRSSRTR